MRLLEWESYSWAFVSIKKCHEPTQSLNKKEKEKESYKYSLRMKGYLFNVILTLFRPTKLLKWQFLSQAFALIEKWHLLSISENKQIKISLKLSCGRKFWTICFKVS
jgi:hypothetical protein